MKLTLNETNGESYAFEKFMDQARHSKLQKALFMAILRTMIYHGKIIDILLEVVEQCQTVEEAVYMASLVDSHRESLIETIIKTPDLTGRVVELGLTQVDESIEDKEGFLLEMEQQYKIAYQNLRNND